MKKVHARRYMIPAAVLAAIGLLFWAGCSKDLMSPDELRPEGSSITNPPDLTSLNKGTISVRGRAEVGATIDIFVKDLLSDTELLEGTTVSSPAVPEDGLGGRFTVEDVNLGEEGAKTIRARITDLYGNLASVSETPLITIILDQTPPPIAFEGIAGAAWKDTLGVWGDGLWKTDLPSITVSGSTDTSASGARLSFGLRKHVARELIPDPHSTTVNFTIDVPSPPLHAGKVDTVVRYSLEAVDAAGNVDGEPLYLHWKIEGQEEELSLDDGTYNSHDHTVKLRRGQKLAVGYQAPTWARYVTKIVFYNANDQVTDPSNPTADTSEPFAAWVWGSLLNDTPGAAGMNEGHMEFTAAGEYPENEWVTITFPRAIEITDNVQYPDKKFYLGIEWLMKDNPWIYEDHSPPIAYTSWVWNAELETWERHEAVNPMIRAIVSDVESLDGKGREAVVTPTRVRR